MLEWQWSYVLLVGTVVAFLGFIKWPKSSFELIHPRFVVPGIIWMATFGQAMVRAPENASYLSSLTASARYEYGDAALWYTVGAMLCFYLGLLLPLGRGLAAPFRALESHFQVNMAGVRRIAWIGTWLVFALFIVAAGPRGLGLSSIGSLVPLSPGFVKYASMGLALGSVFNAVMLGISWPEPHQRTVVTYLMMFFGLFLNSINTMPVFSRGAGLVVFVAAMAYSIRVRRFRLAIMVPAILWVALCAHSGLVGRGIYGRNSDVPTYLSVLFRYGLADPLQMLRSGFGLNDCFTSLAMSMKAIGRADIRPLSAFHWLLFQLPLPHWFGFMPDWTLDLTLYIGGYGSWGYTVGVLGDTFVHWGWFGILWFIVIGVANRLITTLVFRPESLAAGGISAYSLVLFASYYAVGAAVFNNFRSWVVGFTLPLVLVCALLALRRVFAPPQMPAELEPLPAPEPVQGWA